MAWLWKSKKTLPLLKFSSDLVHESEAFQQAYHSILILCGNAPIIQAPSRLLLSRDIERYGILNFAFENAFLYFSDETFSTEQLQPEAIDIILATSDAKLKFLQTYTIFDTKTIIDHQFPSKGLLLVAVYLHNLWVIMDHQPEDKKGIAPNEVDDWVIPLHDFCSLLEESEMMLSLEDNLTAQYLLLRFLAISNEQAPTDKLTQKESIQLFSQLRKNQPTIAILLEQLFKYIPLSYLWFMEKSPYHLPPHSKEWIKKCKVLFSRKALPLLMTLADYLVFSIFKTKVETVESEGNIIYTTYNKQALDHIRLFFSNFEEQVGLNKYFTTFRLLFYFYMVQSKSLQGLERAFEYASEIKKIKPDKEQRLYDDDASILGLFLDDCALLSSVLPVAIANKKDDLFQSIERMVNGLKEHGFSRRCQRLANRISKG